MTGVDDYDWLSRFDITVALVADVDEGRVFDVLAARPNADVATVGVVLDRQAAEQDVERSGSPTMLTVHRRGRWMIAVHHGGNRAVRQPYIAELSRHAIVVVVQWFGSTLGTQFAYAVDGTVLRTFEPAAGPPPPGTGTWQGAALPEEGGLPFDPRPGSAFVLMERLTGVVVTEDDVAHRPDRHAVGLDPE